MLRRSAQVWNQADEWSHGSSLLEHFQRCCRPRDTRFVPGHRLSPTSVGAWSFYNFFGDEPAKLAIIHVAHSVQLWVAGSKERRARVAGGMCVNPKDSARHIQFRA